MYLIVRHADIIELFVTYPEERERERERERGVAPLEGDANSMA